MRVAHDHHGRVFDVVIACDNAIPHLLSDEEILVAVRQSAIAPAQEAAASSPFGTTIVRKPKPG